MDATSGANAHDGRNRGVEHTVAFLGDRVCVAMTKKDVENWNVGKRGRVGDAGRV